MKRPQWLQGQGGDGVRFTVPGARCQVSDLSVNGEYVSGFSVLVHISLHWMSN